MTIRETVIFYKMWLQSISPAKLYNDVGAGRCFFEESNHSIRKLSSHRTIKVSVTLVLVAISMGVASTRKKREENDLNIHSHSGSVGWSWAFIVSLDIMTRNNEKYIMVKYFLNFMKYLSFVALSGISFQNYHVIR